MDRDAAIGLQQDLLPSPPPLRGQRLLRGHSKKRVFMLRKPRPFAPRGRGALDSVLWMLHVIDWVCTWVTWGQASAHATCCYRYYA